MVLKILVIDPKYIDADYIQAFFKSCNKMTEATLVSEYGIEETESDHILKWFYKFSNRMKRRKLRMIIRGLEYVWSYFRILKHVKRHFYDVVHIHWALMPKIDKFFFIKIKKNCGKLVYTAHDVIDHIRPERHIEEFRKIYSIPERIIIHGLGCKKEMETYYPEFASKIYVQDFGVFTKKINNKKIFKPKIFERVEETKGRIFLSIGRINYNKGPDRILKFWLNKYKGNDDLLIIAGSLDEKYKELDELIAKIADTNNIIYYPEYLPVDLHDYLYSICDIVVLPYRHASMSGVFFSAAQFEKTVICTSEGSIAEYIHDKKNVYLCTNDGSDFEDKLEFVMKSVSKEQLRIQGKRFSNDIYERYGWDNIIRGVIKNCYLGTNEI